MMKLTLSLCTGMIAAVHAGAAIADIEIREYPPGVAVNGAVVPTEATFSPPLSAGQIVVIGAAGAEAMRMEVLEGEVFKLSTRVKMPESGEITYKRIRAGAALEGKAIAVQIKDGVRPSGVASLVAKGSEMLREKSTKGSYRMLVYTENGLRSVVVLHDAGFRIRISGSNALSNRLFIGVDGSFSDKLTSEFSEPK
jgi:hypothetical protein